MNVDFDWQCYFELIKLTKFFTQKKTPFNLRWSWHWFSLTENFWTWLSETRSRGGARRAAQFFFWKTTETCNFGFLARKPTPPAQGPIFKVWRPGVGRPSACRLTWSWTCQIAPWAGGVGSVNVAVAACLVLVADWRKSGGCLIVGFKFECMYVCCVEIRCLKRFFSCMSSAVSSDF